MAYHAMGISLFGDIIQLSRKYAINFKMHAYSLSIDPKYKYMEVPAAGGWNEIRVTSNTSWHISCNFPNSILPWLQGESEDYTGDQPVPFFVHPNPSTSPREAQIIFSAKGCESQVCTVKQLGVTTPTPTPTPSLTITSGRAMTIAATASSPNDINNNSITVKSNTDWTVSTETEWLTLVEPTSGNGSGDGTIKFKAEANTTTAPRTGTITFSATGCESQVCTVTQRGATPSLSVPNTKDIKATACTDSITVESNTDWWVSTETEWLTLVEPTSGKGNGNGTIKFRAEANPSTNSREGTITFSAQGCTSQACTVTQRGADPSLSINPIKKDLDASVSSESISVTSNTFWTVSKDASWLSLDKTSGTGNGSITFRAEANSKAESREGVITFSANGCAPQSCKVSQPSPLLSVPNTKNIAAVTSSGNSISVTSNTSWSVKYENALWLKLDKMSGRGNGNITFRADANTSAASREAEIKFYASGCDWQVCTVKQSGASPSLSISPTTMSIDAADGWNNISVTSNASWSVSTDASWLWLNTTLGNGNDVVTFIASENRSTSSRKGQITFSADGCTPQVCTVTQAGGVASKLNLQTGWNWVGFQKLPTSHKVGDVLGMTGFTVNDVIQSSTGSSRFNGTSWIPSNFTIEYGKLYMICVSTPVTVTLTGKDNGSMMVPVNEGWNWIANPTTADVTPNQLTHSAGWSAGDCIQTTNGSVTYNGNQWIPSTGFRLEVGKGYQLKVAKAGSVYFMPIDGDALYVVVDLSDGPNAESYPVRYSSTGPDLGLDMCRTTELWLRCIPAGSILMGSRKDEVGRNDEYDMVLHSVTISRMFYIGVFECTQRQWELVMGDKPSYFNNTAYYATRPVENVSYDTIRGTASTAGAGWPTYGHKVDSMSFMGKLQEKTGMVFDLPTEAQWEYACRAGTTTALNSGKDLKDPTGQDAAMDEVGRYWFNGGSGYSQNCTDANGTAKVGSYLPNAWGLYDMHGNVYEWCLDWWGASLTSTTVETDPVGPNTGSFRVIRGGFWSYYAEICRSAFRNGSSPSNYGNSVGFRVVWLP